MSGVSRLTLAIYYPFAHALIAYEETEYCPECGSSQEMEYEDSEHGFGHFVVRGKRGVGAGH